MLPSDPEVNRLVPVLSLEPNHIAVAYHHSGGSVTGEMVNTMVWDLTTSDFATTGLAVNAISQAWADGPHASHATMIHYDKMTGIVHDPILGLTAVESVTGAIGGSGSNPPAPLSVAVIVQKTTAFAGRKFRGRLFFGGFPVGTLSTSNPNVITPTFQTSLNAAFESMRTSLVGHGVLPLLRHPGTGTGSVTLISHFDVHALVGTVRKRIR